MLALTLIITAAILAFIRGAYRYAGQVPENDWQAFANGDVPHLPKELAAPSNNRRAGGGPGRPSAADTRTSHGTSLTHSKGGF